jgi:hypothetical protein
VATGPARAGLAVAAGAGGVHRPERRRGGREEHARMLLYRCRDGLATDEAGLDQLVGVCAVGAGAGRADRGAAVPARGVDDGVGQVQRRRRRQHGTGAAADLVQVAAQPDRAGAPSGVQDVRNPARVVLAGRPPKRSRDVRAESIHGSGPDGHRVGRVVGALLGGGPHPRPTGPQCVGEAGEVEGEGQRRAAALGGVHRQRVLDIPDAPEVGDAEVDAGRDVRDGPVW